MDGPTLIEHAGKCVADCGGFLDRGDAIYWTVGGATIILAGLGAPHLKRRQGQLLLVLLSAAVLGAALSAWLTAQFIHENLGGDFLDWQTGEPYLRSIALVFLPLAAICSLPFALIGSVAVFVINATRRRRNVG